MKVTLRQRLKGDKISLYLEYYSNGKRQYEYLNLYLTPDPEKGKLTNAVKEENKKILALAEPSAVKGIWRYRTALMISTIRRS